MLTLRNLSLIIVSLLAIGCTTNRQDLEKIRHAEEITIEKPDSALCIMRSINADDIHGSRNKAYYQLIFCESLYYNYSEGNNDSMTRSMVDYYINSNRHDERARAMFQHAQVKKNNGENSDAMFFLMEAEKSLQQASNPRLEGLTHRAKAEIYSAEYLFNNALNEYLKAKECFEEAGTDYHESHSDYDIGRIYLSLQEFDKAEEHLYRALDFAANSDIEELTSEILYNLLDTYCSLSEYEKLVQVIDNYDEHLENGHDNYFRYMAIYNAYNGNREEAISNLASAKESGCEIILLEHTSYIVYSILRDNEKALYYLESCIKRQNGQILHSLNAPILNMQLELEIEEKMELEIRSRYLKLLFALIIIIVVVILTSFTYIKMIRKKAEIELLKSHIENILTDLESETNKVKSLTEIASSHECMVATMRKNITEHIRKELRRINDLLDAYYSDVTKVVKHNQIAAELDRYVRDFADSPNGYQAVEQYVNDFYDGIMIKLRGELPTLKEEEYRLLCLIYGDFSSNAICMFMGYDKNKLYKHKSKLKALLVSSKAKHKVEFIKNLR